MQKHGWVEEFPGAVTVCDDRGIIVEMNDRAAAMFVKRGGRALIGTNVLDCHPEPSLTKLKHLMEQRLTSIYTTEKKGVKRLIYQAPWLEEGVYRGFVEMVMELPESMPHFIRDGS